MRDAIYVAHWDDGAFQVYGPGIDDRISAPTALRYFLFVGGRWILTDGHTGFRLLFRDLIQRSDLRLRGNPRRIFSAHLPAHGLQLLDGSTLMHDQPVSARQAYGWLEELIRVVGHLPRSLSALVSAQLGEDEIEREPYPVRGEVLRFPPESRQQLFSHQCDGEITQYDLRAAYGAVLLDPIPTGQGPASVPRGVHRSCEECECHVRLYDVTVRDLTNPGVFAFRSGNSGRPAFQGMTTYRTTIAEPILDCALDTHMVRLEKIHCVWSYEALDLSRIVSWAWSERRRHELTGRYNLAGMWRAGLQQFCGKFAETPLSCLYRFTTPGEVEGHRVISIDPPVYSRDQGYYPPMYHPTASGWIRQVAQRPLLEAIRSEATLLRIYVDSVTVEGDRFAPRTDTPEVMGSWRTVAEGVRWQAEGPGRCRLTGADGRVTFECGPAAIPFRVERRP
jgi:hypothetical protein